MTTATKTHYTAKELAGLPGMPKTIKGVIDRKYPSRPIKKLDGTDSKYLEYALVSLPHATQLHLKKQHLASLPAIREAAAPPAIIETAQLPALTSRQGLWSSGR